MTPDLDPELVPDILSEPGLDSAQQIARVVESTTPQERDEALGALADTVDASHADRLMRRDLLLAELHARRIRAHRRLGRRATR